MTGVQTCALPIYNEIVSVCNNNKFLIICLFDKSRDLSTYNYFKYIERNNKNLKVVYDPKVKNLADAYYRANLYGSAINAKWTLSMVGGYRHSPKDLTKFINKFNCNYKCIWGYRTQLSSNSPPIRKFVSFLGNFFSKIILNISIPDLTSGFYAIRSKNLLDRLIKIKSFVSSGHFIDTELKFYFKNLRFSLINISYKTYNKTISFLSILDAIRSLLCLFLIRINFKSFFCRF